VLTGSIFIVYEVTDDTVDPAWVTAAGLILLGVVALIVTLVRAAQPPRNLDEQ
jgi:Co/Zn/Cd efflux system component